MSVVPGVDPGWWEFAAAWAAAWFRPVPVLLTLGVTGLTLWLIDIAIELHRQRTRDPELRRRDSELKRQQRKARKTRR